MSGKGTRRRLVQGVEVSVFRVGKGQASTVHVKGLPTLSQADARWLVDALSRVVVMPPDYYKDAR